MTRDVFPQTTIAVIWDFDKTLTPDYMQKPLFEHFEVDEELFWQEVKGLEKFYKARGLDLVSKDTLYLNHILTYVREGKFNDLNNQLLFNLGAKIKFYPGLPKFFEKLKKSIKEEKYERFKIAVEIYVVSTGLRQMILGSKIAKYINGVWACEFVSDIAPPGYLTEEEKYPLALEYASTEEIRKGYAQIPIKDIGYVLDNTTKTRAIFEINKGANVEPGIDVNSPISKENRRIPFENMIYVADGPSDVPVFSLVKSMGGCTCAVYKPGDKTELGQVDDLLQNGRIHCFGEANYSVGTQTSMWLLRAVQNIAESIVQIKERDLKEKVGPIPGHLT